MGGHAGELRWWQEVLERPGLLLQTRAATAQVLLDNDHPIDTAPASGSAKRSRANNNTSGSAKKPKSEAPHPRMSQGRYATNNQGKELCTSFNSDSCQSTQGITCPMNPARVHVCSICLAPHSARECPRSSKQSKGKGGGKKGKKPKTDKAE